MMYANSKKQPLLAHCLQVEQNANLVFDNMFSDFNSPNKLALASAISIGSLFHDTGKVLEFQDYIMGETNYDFSLGEGTLYSQDNPLHHELSLLLLSAVVDNVISVKHPSMSENARLKLLVKQLTAHACYWHHAEPVRDCKLETVLDDYFRDDKRLNDFAAKSSSFLSELFGFELELSSDDILAAIDSFKTPSFIKCSYHFPDSFNSWTKEFKAILDFNVDCQVARFATIYADRHVSSLDADEMAESISFGSIDDCTLLAAISDYIELDYMKGERTDIQLNAAKEFAESDVSTIVGAAGAGKTRVALMGYKNCKELNSKHNGILWVCPRIAVGLSVFEELTEALPSAKVAIVTGESKQVWQNGEQIDVDAEDLFKSDVVITTIDQVAKWLTKNGSSPMFAEFVNRFVVFDEYHELFSIKSLYYISAMLIRLKERQDKGHLLISATPELVHLSLICRHEASVNMSIELRSFNEKPVHVYFDKSASMNESGAVYVFNTATKAQVCAANAWEERSDIMCYHSKFSPSDKQHLTHSVLDKFGRKSTDLSATLFAGPIAQASLNISRAKLFTEATHPSNLIQRFGRCNRFGEFDFADILVLVGNKQVNETVGNYGAIGSVKNTGSRKSMVKNGRVIEHPSENHYTVSSYNFFQELITKFTETNEDGEVVRTNTLHGNKIVLSVNELNDFYLSYQMSELNDSSKLMIETKEFVADAIRYLEIVDLFKPTKITFKTSGAAEAKVTFRGESLWATMTCVKVTPSGFSLGELIGLPSSKDDLVTLTESDLTDVDVLKNLMAVKSPEFDKLKSSITHRAKKSGNSKVSHLYVLAKNNAYPLVASTPSTDLDTGVYYLKVENKHQKELVIGFMNLAEGTQSISQKLGNA